MLCSTELIPIPSDGSSLLLRHSVLLEGRLKTVSALCLESSRKKLLIGTEGGNIYQLRLRGFCLEEEIIYQVVDDIVLCISDFLQFRIC